jgi:hypothetical protein
MFVYLPFEIWHKTEWKKIGRFPHPGHDSEYLKQLNIKKYSFKLKFTVKKNIFKQFLFLRRAKAKVTSIAVKKVKVGREQCQILCEIAKHVHLHFGTLYVLIWAL